MRDQMMLPNLAMAAAFGILAMAAAIHAEDKVSYLGCRDWTVAIDAFVTEAGDGLPYVSARSATYLKAVEPCSFSGVNVIE